MDAFFGNLLTLSEDKLDIQNKHGQAISGIYWGIKPYNLNIFVTAAAAAAAV